MKNFLKIFAKYKAWTLAFLQPLGFWGLGVAAIADAAAIPLPYDLLVAGFIWENKRYFYICILAASVGSAIGGLVPYFIGREGGELFLQKRINPHKFERLRDRFETQEFLAILIPSILPPPMPWKVFVFGAGVFRMKVPQFMLAVVCGRVVRNSVTAYLVIRYGPQIVHAGTHFASHHGALLLAVLIALIGAAAYWFLRKKRKTRKREPHHDRQERSR